MGFTFDLKRYYNYVVVKHIQIEIINKLIQGF